MGLQHSTLRLKDIKNGDDGENMTNSQRDFYKAQFTI